MPYKSKYDLSSKSVRIYENLLTLEEPHNIKLHLKTKPIGANKIKEETINNYLVFDEDTDLSYYEIVYFHEVLQYFGLKFKKNAPGIDYYKILD
jgi:hypothetical protein